MFFVICKETSSTQRPVALSEDGTPDRDRQKLIREQEVLKEVSAEGEIEVVFYIVNVSFFSCVLFWVDYESCTILCTSDFICMMLCITLYFIIITIITQYSSTVYIGIAMVVQH